MIIKRFIKKLLGQYNASLIAKAFYIIPNFFCSFLRMNDEIILESNPDFSCNTYELYRLFLKKGLNKKYKLVWRVRNPELYTECNLTNVSFISKYPSGALNRIKNYIRCNRAKVSISCNMNLPKYKVAKRQINIYLDHGSQLKSMRSKDGQKAPLNCDYLISQSKFFVPYHLQEYSIREEQIICTGLPRDDQFFRENTSIRKLISDVDSFKKVIIWTPTFRVHKNGYRVDCNTEYPFGLPFIFEEKDIEALARCLEAEKVLLIIKPHPVQDVSNLKNIGTPNIRVIFSEALSQLDIQINELLSQTDAMITDYSSIYYDYLFTEKPIALTLDDMQQYQDSKGFVFDNPLDVLRGELLYSLEDLCGFIKNVSLGIDPLLNSRRELQRKINDYNDGGSSERVYNFIMDKLRLKG